MWRSILGLVAVGALCVPAPAAEPGSAGANPNVVAPNLPLPLAFVENAGQFASDVRFRARVPGLWVSVLDDGWTVQATDGSSAVRVRFEGASSAARAEGIEPLSGSTNYLIGAPECWVRGARSFARVRVTDILPGVDLELFENEGRLEYDLHVAPGVDQEAISFTVTGAPSRLEEDGALEVTLDGRAFRQRAPRSWEIGPTGSRRALRSAFRELGPGRYGFEVEGRDATRRLVIDPVLVYSEFVGGSSADEAFDVAADSTGCVYVTGWAKSVDFPGAPGGRAGKDVVVFKLDTHGSLLWATWFGGARDDAGHAIVVDDEGNVFVAGVTRSSDFPATQNVLDRTHNGGTDVFVLRLDPDGRTLRYATFIGGSDDDLLEDLAIGRDGSAYLVGSTRSDDYPVSAHAHQREREGSRDAFVTKLDPRGMVSMYSTLLGGVRDDGAHAVAVNHRGHAFVTGHTDSADFPSTTAAFDRSKNEVDAFVTKVSTSGGELVYSTFLGGSGRDEGHGIEVGRQGDVFVVGWTQSFDFPVTSDAMQDKSRASRDAFLVRLSESGGVQTYGTYLGGTGHDEAHDVAVDAYGTPWIVGQTTSKDLPLSPDAVQVRRGGGVDAFLLGFDPMTNAITFGTYLGGKGDEAARGVAVLPFTESIVLAGFASDVPPRRGAEGDFKRPRTGPSDALVARYEPGLCGARAEVSVLGTSCGVSLQGTPPRLGRIFELRVSDAPPNTQGYVMVSAPTYSSTEVEGICERHVDSKSTRILLTFRTDEKGEYVFRTRLPKQSAYCGRTMTVQVATLDAELGPLSFGQMSQGLLITIGD